MREAVLQSIQNLRANKLRSLLTMFGIIWGMISIVVLSATGEGFRRGNEKVLLELGKNIAIVWRQTLSLRIADGRPYSENSNSKTSHAGLASVPSSASQPMM